MAICTDRQLLTAADAATHLGLSVVEFNALRHSRRGPDYIKLGRTIRFRSCDLERWLKQTNHEEG